MLICVTARKRVLFVSVLRRRIQRALAVPIKEDAETNPDQLTLSE